MSKRRHVGVPFALSGTDGPCFAHVASTSDRLQSGCSAGHNGSDAGDSHFGSRGCTGAVDIVGLGHNLTAGGIATDWRIGDFARQCNNFRAVVDYFP